MTNCASRGAGQPPINRFVVLTVRLMLAKWRHQKALQWIDDVIATIDEQRAAVVSFC